MDVAAGRPGRRTSPGLAVGFGTAVLTFATISLFAVPSFAGPLAEDFDLSGLQVGLLTSAFAVAYAAVQVPSGVLGDAVGVNVALGAGLVVLGVSFVGSVLAPSFGALLPMRALSGIGAGMLLPLASSLVRAVAAGGGVRGQGVLGTGWGLGYVLSLLALPLVFGSWRDAFLGLGALALAGGIAGVVVLPRARRPSAAVAVAEARAGLAHRGTWLLGAYLFGVTFANVGVGAWALVYAEDELGLSGGSAGAFVSLIGWGLLPASIVGVLAAGRAGPRAVLLSSAVALGIAVLLAALPVPPALVGAGLLALGWFSAFPFGVVLGLVASVLTGPGAQAQGAVVGAVNGLAFLAGSVAPPLVGAILDGTSSFTAAFLPLLAGPALAFAAARGALRGSRTDPVPA